MVYFDACPNYERWHVAEIPFGRYILMVNQAGIGNELFCLLPDSDILQWLESTQGRVELCVHCRDRSLGGKDYPVACFEDRREAAEFKLRWAGVL